ncbi:MAG: hypothetical protein CMF83_01925 [Candidatus Marinimicrobia bacterium]|nr:hypothetical protein [Candidatus Neomarinimicrobiota bacterium]
MMQILKNKGRALYFCLFITLAIMSSLKYHNLNTTFFDLGLFLNNFSMIASGQWQSLFLSHIQPLGLFWAIPFYFFSIDWAATIILICQAAFLVLPVVGLYRHFGIIPALAFSFYFPLWYNALFDFHMDHLAIPILFGFFFFERKGKLSHAISLAALLALVKEPFALQTAFCGLYLIARKKHLSGLLLTLFGMIYFILATQYIQHYFNSPFISITGGWDLVSSNALGWLGNSKQEIILFLITNPYSVLLEIVTNQEKVKYVLYIFGALGFIPLLRPIILLPAIPILLISLLSNIPEHHAYNTHYTAGLIAPLIMAFSEGLPTARKLWDKTICPNHLFTPTLIGGLLVCHVLASPSPISRIFFIEKSWFYHYKVYLPSKRTQMIKSALKKYIPTNPEIVVSMQNTLNWGYLTKQKTIFVFPDGVIEKGFIPRISQLNWSGFWNFLKNQKLEKNISTSAWADYVILDFKKPWFIFSQGCHWITETCHEGQQEFINRFSSLVAKTKENFEMTYENDGFIILKHRSNQAKIIQPSYVIIRDRGLK